MKKFCQLGIRTSLVPMNVCAIKISLLVYLSKNGHLLQEMYRKDHQTKRKYGMQQVRIFSFWNVDIYILSSSVYIFVSVCPKV